MSRRTASSAILGLVLLIVAVAAVSVVLALTGGLTLYLSAALTTVSLVAWLVASVVWWFWG